MFLFGKNIQSPTDKLEEIDITTLFNMVKNPDASFIARIRQLKTIEQIDPKLYAKSKKLLPYFVCADFNPKFRKTENFAYIENFVIDIDNLNENNIDMSTLRAKLEHDARTMLLFASPSMNGLKIVMRLKERCYDHGLYSLFYKEFVLKFASQYHIENAVDLRTSDVCRACFISADADAYINTAPISIDMNNYINISDSVSMFDMKKEQDEKDKIIKEQEDLQGCAPHISEPADDAMAHIKEVLQQRKQNKKILPSPVYVPNELEAFIGGVKGFLEDNGIDVYDIQNIQYGKKIKCKLGFKKSEMNLFYGKRGFKIIASPKSDVSSELNQLLVELVQGFIDDNT